MKKLILVVLLFGLFPLSVQAETLQFTPPTQNEDGSAYTDRGSYRVLLRDTPSGIVATTADFPDDGFIDTITYTVPPGDHYLSLIAVNASGHTSPTESNQELVNGGDIIIIIRPNSPTQLRVLP